jgi:hypothetical protein
VLRIYSQNAICARFCLASTRIHYASSMVKTSWISFGLLTVAVELAALSFVVMHGLSLACNSEVLTLSVKQRLCCIHVPGRPVRRLVNPRDDRTMPPLSFITPLARGVHGKARKYLPRRDPVASRQSATPEHHGTSSSSEGDLFARH